MAGMWILVLVVAIVCAQPPCEKYECYEGDSKNLLVNTCAFFNTYNNTFLLSPCDQKSNMTYCPPITTPGNSTCLPLGPSNIGTAYPGEPCTGDLMCINGGLCQDGACVANSIAMNCTDVTDCNVGLTCYKNTCKLQKPLGSACSSDYHCVNNAGCNNTVCSLYFRQQEGQAVSDCEPSIGSYSWSNMCQSGMCMCGHAFHNKTCAYGYCLKPLSLSSPDSIVNCTDDGDSVCNSIYYANSSSQLWNLEFFTQCQCGRNPNGDAFCSLFPGDPPALKYYNKLQQWMNSTEINSCHTARRWDLDCIQLYWSKRDFIELKFFAYQYWYFPQIQNIDSCTKAIYFNDYAQVEDMYNAATWHNMMLMTLFALIIA